MGPSLPTQSVRIKDDGARKGILLPTNRGGRTRRVDSGRERERSLLRTRKKIFGGFWFAKKNIKTEEVRGVLHQVQKEGKEGKKYRTEAEAASAVHVVGQSYKKGGKGTKRKEGREGWNNKSHSK